MKFSKVSLNMLLLSSLALLPTIAANDMTVARCNLSGVDDSIIAYLQDSEGFTCADLSGGTYECTRTVGRTTDTVTYYVIDEGGVYVPDSYSVGTDTEDMTGGSGMSSITAFEDPCNALSELESVVGDMLYPPEEGCVFTDVNQQVIVMLEQFFRPESCKHGGGDVDLGEYHYTCESDWFYVQYIAKDTPQGDKMPWDIKFGYSEATASYPPVLISDDPCNAPDIAFRAIVGDDIFSPIVNDVPELDSSWGYSDWEAYYSTAASSWDTLWNDMGSMWSSFSKNATDDTSDMEDAVVVTSDNGDEEVSADEEESSSSGSSLPVSSITALMMTGAAAVFSTLLAGAVFA